MTKPILKVKRPPVALPSALTFEERTKLAALLNSDVFQKAFGFSSQFKPSVFFSGAGTTIAEMKDAPTAMLMANNRLHEIRGWEMFSAALFAQVEDPKPKLSPTLETYPDV